MRGPLTAILMAILLAGCGGGGKSRDAQEPSPDQTSTVDQTDPSLIWDQGSWDQKDWQ